MPQVGPGQVAAHVAPYYSPPPSGDYNFGAAFLSGFLATRNPWATELFMMRLRAMDPTARMKELNAAAETLAGLERARSQMDGIKLQSETAVRVAELNRQGTMYAADQRLNAEKYKLEYDRLAKTYGIDTPAQERVWEELYPQLQEVVRSAAGVERGVAPDLDPNLLGLVRSNLGKLSPQEQAGVASAIAGHLEAHGVKADHIPGILGQMGTAAGGRPDLPEFGTAKPDVGEVLAAVDAAGPGSLAVTEVRSSTREPGGSPSVPATSYGAGSPRPDPSLSSGPVAPPGEEQEAPGEEEQAPQQDQAPQARTPADDLRAKMLELVGDVQDLARDPGRDIGRVGDPIFSKQPERHSRVVRMLDRVLASPEADASFRTGAQAFSEREKGKPREFAEDVAAAAADAREAREGHDSHARRVEHVGAAEEEQEEQEEQEEGRKRALRLIPGLEVGINKGKLNVKVQPGRRRAAADAEEPAEEPAEEKPSAKARAYYDMRRRQTEGEATEAETDVLMPAAARQISLNDAIAAERLVPEDEEDEEDEEELADLEAIRGRRAR